MRRKSLRQVELLLQLKRKPAKTVVELASRAGALRESVSRSLNTFEAHGLVVKEHGRWQLTLNGFVAAVDARETLSDKRDVLQDKINRIDEVLEIEKDRQ